MQSTIFWVSLKEVVSMKKFIFKKVKGWDGSHWLNSKITLALTGGKSLFLYVNVSLLKTENKKKHEIIADRIVYAKPHSSSGRYLKFPKHGRNRINT